MPRIDALASQTHFVDHLLPVWLALPEEARGTLHIRDRNHPGIPNATREAIPKSRNPTLTASAGDLSWARRVGRPAAVMEHGCGQSFGGGPRPKNHSSYAGGSSRDAQLFLHPGTHPASRDRAVHPEARIEVVGCPKLDSLPRKEERSDPPVVAVSFHWNCGVVPETRWALPDFRRHVPNLAETGKYKVIGHGHPRAAERLKHWFTEHGIEWVATFEEVCRRADLYVNDASSTLFEFAATGRPVVVMNADCYRRNVSHGLRFWEASTVGVEATSKTGLIDPVSEALRDNAKQRAAREKALDLVYAYRTGAAERAAAVLLEWAGA